MSPTVYADGVFGKRSRSGTVGTRHQVGVVGTRKRSGSFEVPAVLLETWYADSNFIPSITLTSGTCTGSNGSAASLRDGSDATGDSTTVAGDGVNIGVGNRTYGFTLGAGVIEHANGTIQYVRVRVRAVLNNNNGSTSVVYMLFRGQRFANDPPGDDYLSMPPEAFTPTWVENNYTTDPSTAAPWVRADILSNIWSIQYLISTLTENDTDTITVTEFAVELWGRP